MQSVTTSLLRPNSNGCCKLVFAAATASGAPFLPLTQYLRAKIFSKSSILRKFSSARPLAEEDGPNITLTVLPDSETSQTCSSASNSENRSMNHASSRRFMLKSAPAPKRMTVVTPVTTKQSPTFVNGQANKHYNKESFSHEDPDNDESPSVLQYTGDAIIPITSTFQLIRPQDDTPPGIWPVFRLMDENGEFRDPECDNTSRKNQKETTVVPFTRLRQDDSEDLNSLRNYLAQRYSFQKAEIESNGLLHPSTHPFQDTQSTDTLLRAHRQMIRLREMDSILQNAQRQGRISFYMTCTGEEAIHMGAASALENNDHVFAQYREQGVLMWRGFTLEQFTNQCFSNDRDLGKGRQMPVHYGSRALHYHTVSSPLGTQLPQAAGAAYRLKLAGQPNVVIAFFGDGCASTTDFHAALNFAATLSCPVIFFCRNNGYAISTPVTDQYAGDGVVSRAPGYGMAAVRVDGNDAFAVHAAVREAKRYALEHSAPVLIEAMTYRQGHHSTSDDSTRYRSHAEIQLFADRMDPLQRMNHFLKRHNYITDEEIATIKDQERIAVREAIQKAEHRPKPSMESMFEDVYKEMPGHLQEQLRKLQDHVAKHPGKY